MMTLTKGPLGLISLALLSSTVLAVTVKPVSAATLRLGEPECSALLTENCKDNDLGDIDTSLDLTPGNTPSNNEASLLDFDFNSDAPSQGSESQKSSLLDDFELNPELSEALDALDALQKAAESSSVSQPAPQPQAIVPAPAETEPEPTVTVEETTEAEEAKAPTTNAQSKAVTMPEQVTRALDPAPNTQETTQGLYESNGEEDVLRIMGIDFRLILFFGLTFLAIIYFLTPKNQR